MSDERPCKSCRHRWFWGCELWECKYEPMAMTNERAIELLSHLSDKAEMDVLLSPEETEAMKWGVEAIKSQMKEEEEIEEKR